MFFRLSDNFQKTAELAQLWYKKTPAFHFAFTNHQFSKKTKTKFKFKTKILFIPESRSENFEKVQWTVFSQDLG